LRTALALITLLASPAIAQLRATTDPRVEIISIVFRIAGNPEYNQGRLTAYIDDVDNQFAMHESHDIIALARSLRASRGVSFDACMSMAVHLDVKDRTFIPRRPFDEDLALDQRWPRDKAAQFVDLLNVFASDTDFWSFYDAHTPLYDLAAERMNAVLDAGFDQTWFDRFYATEPTGSFELILAPTNGGQAYGPKFIDDAGIEHVYAIVGIWRLDEDDQPAFDAGMASTIVHEFCHSFANPQIDRLESELADAGRALYPLVADAMRRQAYSNWKTMLYESLVRASVCRYVLEHDGEEAAQRHIDYEISRSFLWTRDLAALLGEYEADRERYPTFDAFMPRVVAFFDEQPPIIKDYLDKLEATEPHVVRTIPPDGAEGVDPSLAAITATFDRPMKASWSFMLSPEFGQAGFPKKTGDASLSADALTVTLPVALQPNTTYELWLNRPGTSGFQSAEGSPLQPYRIRFTTDKRP
jgi:hypothetical protein